MKKYVFAAALSGFLLAGVASAQDAPPPPPPAPDGAAPMHHMARGPISRADYLARADQRFDRMDANHDGFLTADEIGAMGHRPGGDGDGPGAQFIQRRIERMDTDHDGKISRDEFRAEAAQRFDRADTNHDGVLDDKEQAAMRGPMHGMMRGGWKHRGEGDAPPPPPPPAPAPDTDQ